MDFKRRYGVIVIGVWRKKDWIADRISRHMLTAGDVLVLEGDEDAMRKLAEDPAFLMLIPFQGEAKMRRKAPLAALIMCATITAAATGLLEIEMAALAGAVLLVLTRCLTTRQAYRAIDTRIFVFIAGAIPLGLAMEKCGASAWLAGALSGGLQHLPAFWVLLLLFGIVAVLTQFMSDAATVALFGPVAASLAKSLGHSPTAYVVTVAMASVTAFITPIGHHGNLLVLGPGGYRFTDFMKVGVPLTLLVALVVVWLSRLLWGA